ncbi:MAG: hypothetical protein NBV67_18825 [Tagaea sp.]|nr:hypothetical protein [Tagaea sp.]
MKGSMIRGLAGAALVSALAAAPAIAFDPDPPRDPRTAGLTPISAGSRGNEVVRVDRWPDGTPRRCVRAARLTTPDEGGPSWVEFGVERIPPDAADITMFFQIRYLAAPNGKPLAVRDPRLTIRLLGPTVTWRAHPVSDGWFRGAKPATHSDEDERHGFMIEVEKPGNEFVSTFPDGTHRLHEVRGGVSFWHFNMFVDCACRLAADMPQETRDWLLCPKPRRD